MKAKGWMAAAMVLCAVSVPSWAAMSHMMNDVGTALVFADDFEDASYTDKWTTYAMTETTFAQADGCLLAQISNGQMWSYGLFFTKGSVDVSSATGKKTEVVLAQCNYAAYTFNRTLLVNAQHPWSQGLCVEHAMYNGEGKGQIRFGLYSNDGFTALYDSGSMGSYQYAYSFSVVVDPASGDWSFGWASESGGVSVPMAWGTLTSAEMATYLSSTMYVGTGIYTSSSSSITGNVNRTFDAAVYQVPEPMMAAMLAVGSVAMLRRRM
jgi:hypothetical protein